MKKLGLCLGGGGARGPYQIGAVTALKELGLYEKVEMISGASIGAANASILASTSVEKAKDIWFNMPQHPIDHKESLIELIRESHFHLLDKGIKSMDYFREILSEHVHPKNFNHREVHIAVTESGPVDKGFLELFKVSYEHYIEHKSKSVYINLRELENKYLVDAIVASCSIPFVFPPVINENKKYYDGGVFDNTPVKPLIDGGCDEIIFIGISMIPRPNFKKEYKDVVFHEIEGKRLGRVLDFSIKHSKRLFESGYNDTMTYFNEIL